LIAVGGVSAKALLAPNIEAMNAHRKHKTPNHGHLRPTLNHTWKVSLTPVAPSVVSEMCNVRATLIRRFRSDLAPPRANILHHHPTKRQNCARNNYNIFVFALDPDTPPLDLIFDVNVQDCSPVSHLGNVFVVSCPNNAPTSGVACAEDPDGNTSSRAEFTFQACIPGDCRQFPDACDMLALDPSAR
jgi:hypothetical protein